MLLISLFSFTSLKEETEEDYILVSEEEQTTGLYEEIGDYYLINERYFYLVYGNKKINLGSLSCAKMFLYQDKVILITLADKELSFSIYNSNLELVKSEEIIRNGANSFNAVLEGDVIYIVGESGEENELTYTNDKLFKNDAFFMEFDLSKQKIKSFYYGGKTNEGFRDLVVFGNFYYIVGVKERFGEGDFGNGGQDKSILVTKINQSHKIESYQILDTEDDIRGFYNINNKLYLFTNSSYYVFNENLVLLKKVNLSFELLGLVKAKHNLICLFGRDNYLVMDFESGSLKELRHDLGLYSITKLNEFVLGYGDKKHRIDVVDLVNSKMRTTYSKDNSLMSLFGETKLIKETFNPYLDYQVYGDYDCNLDYETLGGINFSLKRVLTIDYECNLVDGGIYPSGYRVNFTGKGFLDGNQIITNYQLVDSGKHTLVLRGVKGEEKTINFEVSPKQIDFKDYQKRESDVFVNLGDNLNLKLSVELDSRLIIDNVIIDGKEYEVKYDKDKKLIFITMGKMNEVGQFEVFIERINYHDNENSYSIYLGERFLVGVKKPKLEISFNSFEDNKMVVDCIDSYLSARYFEVVLRNEANGIEETYKYPLSTSDIYFENLNSDASYTINYYLVNDYGGRELEHTLISSFNVYGGGQVYVGQIKVLSYEGTLNRFSLELDKDFLEKDLREIVVLDQVIYKNEKESFLKYILLFVLTFMGGLFIPVTIKMIKGKKKQEKCQEEGQ